MALFHTTVVDNQIKALDTIGSASGSVATFDTDRAERLVKCVAEISASATKCYIANMSDITLKDFFEGLMLGTYAFVDLGSLDWQYSATYKWFNPTTISFPITLIERPESNDTIADIVVTGYATSTRNEMANDLSLDLNCCVNTTGYFIIRNLAYDNVNTFKNAMSGVYLIYKLATPTTPTITKSQFETLLNAFDLSGWLFEYDFGETVSSGATIECVSGTLTRYDDTIKSVGGNILTALTDNNIFSSTGNVEVKYILSVGKAIS